MEPPTFSVRNSQKKFVSWKWSLAATVILLVLAACFFRPLLRETLARTDRAVDRFHELLDLGDYESIYEEASDNARDPSRHGELIGLLNTVHGKLGGCISSTATHIDWRLTRS